MTPCVNGTCTSHCDTAVVVSALAEVPADSSGCTVGCLKEAGSAFYACRKYILDPQAFVFCALGKLKSDCYKCVCKPLCYWLGKESKYCKFCNALTGGCLSCATKVWAVAYGCYEKDGLTLPFGKCLVGGLAKDCKECACDALFELSKTIYEAVCTKDEITGITVVSGQKKVTNDVQIVFNLCVGFVSYIQTNECKETPKKWAAAFRGGTALLPLPENCQYANTTAECTTQERPPYFFQECFWSPIAVTKDLTITGTEEECQIQ